MPVIETIDSNTDPVPNTDLPNPENSLNQENISLYGHLFLAALSDGENIKRALNPEEKLDQGTIDTMQVKRLGTADSERKYNPIIKGLSAHERTEKWKGKNFQDAYSEWSTNLLNSLNQSPSQERKELIGKFFGKDFSEIKNEDVKVLYDQYCRNGSNVDDFVKKAVEGESSGVEVEWLAKKLFGTKSGETVKKIFEIEVDIKKAGSIDNALRKANEMFWQSGLDRFNNPNKEEEEILKLLFGNFRQAQKKTDEDSEGAPPAPATEEPSETSTTDTPTPSENPESTEPKKEEADEKDNGTIPETTTEESNETPAIIVTPTDEAAAKSEDVVQNVDSTEEPTEKTDEDYNGAPPVIDEAVNNSTDPITETKTPEPSETPEPTPQVETVETNENPSSTPQIENSEPVNQTEPSTIEPPTINQPETVEPNPISTGTSWPPAEVEPVNNTATSLVQKIKGIFKKK